MALWDTAALFPVLTEAGGTLTDWNGKATHTAPEAIATNGHLFDATMRALRG
jgi:fructose-1,6-bisphosphatase/inositol monophosphatase family enzyme